MKNFDSHPEHREPSRGYKQKIIEAIQQQDKETPLTALEEINKALTGDSQLFDDSGGIDEKEVTQFLATLQETGSADAYIYLGDGGVSRLVLKADDDNVEIFLGDVSSDKVKQKFDEL